MYIVLGCKLNHIQLFCYEYVMPSIMPSIICVYFTPPILTLSTLKLKEKPYINVTPNCHFAFVYLLGITRPQFIRSKAQEPPIYKLYVLLIGSDWSQPLKKIK